MIQDQLVEYISAQMKAGVSRDSIKSTLIGAGWQAADVEDTLQKVGGVNMSQPITVSPTSAMGSSPAAKPSSAGPQTIKMSDLISTSDPAMTSSVTTTTTSTTSSNANAGSASASKSFTGSRPVETKTTATTFTANEFPAKSSSSHGSLITEVILGILVIALGATAGYLYFANGNLNTKLASLNGTNSSAATQLAALQQSVTASTTAWNSQISTLTGENSELQTELSFYVVPPGAAPDATNTATINGTVSDGGKTPYLITATYGAQIYVSNSKDANVTAALATIEASSTNAQFTGTYLPGADSMTLTAINGTTLQ